MPSQLARLGRDRRLHLINQLAGRLVHAYHREPRIIRSFIDIQHLLHLSYEVAVVVWGDYPADFPPRLDFVFLVE
jgi:hypothetical protein